MILYQTSITFISKLKTLRTQDSPFTYSYMLFEYIIDMNSKTHETMYIKLISQLDKIIISLCTSCIFTFVDRL